MAMPPELLDEFRDYERLFGDHGWTRLMREWERRVATIKANALHTITDEKSLWRHRAWVEILEEMIRLPDTIAAARKAAEEAADPATANASHSYED